MQRLIEAGGKRLPFLRWSVLRLMLARNLTKEWQVGDGREEALAEYVAAHARKGDVDDVIRVIDEFCYRLSFMINVGDEKGEILDAAVRRATPLQALELGTYCGYSALRIVRAMPEDGRLVSVEFNAANARIARRIWEHAGVADRVTALVGMLGDGGTTIECLGPITASLAGRRTSCSSTTQKTFTWPTSSESSAAGGCIRVRSSSPITSSFPVRPITAPICGRRRARPGAQPSTTHMPNTRRC